MKMVVRRALNNIQATTSNRNISELTLLYLPTKLGATGNGPLQVLRSLFPYTPDNRLSSSFVFLPFLFPPLKWSFNSRWLDPSTVLCQCVVTQTYFRYDFVSGEKYDIAVCLSPMAPTLTRLWHQTGQPPGTWDILIQAPDLHLDIST